MRCFKTKCRRIIREACGKTVDKLVQINPVIGIFIPYYRPTNIMRGPYLKKIVEDYDSRLWMSIIKITETIQNSASIQAEVFR